MSRCMECNAKGDCEEWCGLTKLDLHDEITELRRDLELAIEAVKYYKANCLVSKKMGVFMGGEFASSEEWGFMVTDKKAEDTIDILKQRGRIK